jgi:DNA polymerase-3 subunit alpha
MPVVAATTSLANLVANIMSNWFPLHTHSHYSLLDGLSKPQQIAERCKALGHAGCALTDHGTISGSISFIKAMKKEGLKSVLGNEFYVVPQDASIKTPENDRRSHLVVLAKNLAGWKALVQATSASQSPEFFYRKPRLDLGRIASFGKGNFIAFSGHLGSDLANVCFVDYRKAYGARTYEAAREFVKSQADLKRDVLALAGKYQELFGKENFFLEIQLIDAINIPAAQIVANILRWVAKQLNIPCVATADSHYPAPEDAEDQRILLCSAFQTTLKEVHTKLAADEDVSLGGFFRSSRYHIPSSAEMEAIHEPEELKNSLRIAEMCEAYDVLGKPMLPQFPCPDGLDAEAYVKRLCAQGWRRRLEPLVKDGHIFNDATKKNVPFAEYAQRMKHELQVIFEAGLAGYFLIVQDYCNWTREQGWLVGPGRGSGAGSLTSYLLGITNIDPLPYDLMFERFYNAGRNQPGRVSLPDIDCDFPVTKRDRIINYIKSKYGPDRVSQMVTFSRLMGRGALKDVLRAHECCSYEEMNKITEHVPDESAIADELQVMREDGKEPSIIQWALENNAEQLKEWCVLAKDGSYEGPFARYFAQAKRLEGTKRSQGKHAAGIVISASPLAEVCPMVYDKSNDCLVAGMEMADLEAMGHVKFDILGIACLDKIMGVQEILRTGTFDDDE